MRTRSNDLSLPAQQALFSDVSAEAEQARRELLAADARLRDADAELRRLQGALEQGLDAIDACSNGRLRKLVEQIGDELAALVDLVLETSEEESR